MSNPSSPVMGVSSDSHWDTLVVRRRRHAGWNSIEFVRWWCWYTIVRKYCWRSSRNRRYREWRSSVLRSQSLREGRCRWRVERNCSIVSCSPTDRSMTDDVSWRCFPRFFVSGLSSFRWSLGVQHWTKDSSVADWMTQQPRLLSSYQSDAEQVYRPVPLLRRTNDCSNHWLNSRLDGWSI